MSEQWYWSTSGERFSDGPWPSRDAAIEDAIEEVDPGATFFTGIRRDLLVDDLVSGECLAESAIDQLGDSAGEEAGEAAAFWPTTSETARSALAEALSDTVIRWAREHEIEPDFFKIDLIEKHEAPAAPREPA